MSIVDKQKVISQNNSSISSKNVTIAENERRVYDSGYDSGYSKGQSVGYENGLDEGYSEGHNQGYSEAENTFWKDFTDSGQRNDYGYAFKRSSFEYIRPSYKIAPTYYSTLGNVFADCKKLKKIEKEYFDFSKKDRGTSNATGVYWTFANCEVLEEIEDIGIQEDFQYSSTFQYNSALHTIEVIRTSISTKWDRAFFRCKSLVNLTIEGVIGQNGFDVSDCPLSHDSLMSIINALADYSSSGTTYTVTLGSANKAKLTEEEQLIATEKGWILA